MLGDLSLFRGKTVHYAELPCVAAAAAAVLNCSTASYNVPRKLPHCFHYYTTWSNPILLHGETIHIYGCSHSCIPVVCLPVVCDVALQQRETTLLGRHLVFPVATYFDRFHNNSYISTKLDWYYIALTSSQSCSPGVFSESCNSFETSSSTVAVSYSSLQTATTAVQKLHN